MLKKLVAIPTLAATLAACSGMVPEQTDNEKIKIAVKSCLAGIVKNRGGEFSEETKDNISTLRAALNKEGVKGQAVVNWDTGRVNVTVAKGKNEAKNSFDFHVAPLRISDASGPGGAEHYALAAETAFTRCYEMALPNRPALKRQLYR